MIQDDEIRELYKVESEEHLQHLDDSLLRLEKRPADKEILEEIMRVAHSLKGASRMAGADEIELLAHALEDVFRAVVAEEIILTAELFDELSHGLEALHALVDEASGGEEAGFDVGALTDHLKCMVEPNPIGKDSAAEDVFSETDPSSMRASAPQLEREGDQDQEVDDEEDVRDHISEQGYQIESVRVNTRKLDKLMTRAAELTVTKGRMGRLITCVDDLLAQTEEWGRDASKRKFHSSNVSAYIPEGSVLDNYEREKNHIHKLRESLSDLRNIAFSNHTQLEAVSNAVMDGVNDLRLLPLSILFRMFPRMVRDIAREQYKEVELIIEGSETRADKRVLEEMKDPLMHLLRNAVDHGIEEPTERERRGKTSVGHIYLRARQTPSGIEIEVGDDGRGLDVEGIDKVAKKQGLVAPVDDEKFSAEDASRVIFSPGFTTSTFVTEVSGRGVGLDAVKATVSRLKGDVHVTSYPHAGCTVLIMLPISLSVQRVLLFEVSGQAYALPVEYIEKSLFVSKKDIFPMEGRSTITLDGQPISVANMGHLLELDGEDGDGGNEMPCIIIADGQNRCGLLVDALLTEQEVMVKPQRSLLKRVRNVAGATILETGRICIILSPQDLMKTLLTVKLADANRQQDEDGEDGGLSLENKQMVLLAEDSITTRTQEKRILEKAGYEVVTAVDGLDAWRVLSERSFDVVISDILMPNMTGLELAEKIRNEPRYQEMPVVLVTSLASPEDRKRGLEVGADAYIVKSAFDQTVLLDTLKRLV